VEIDYSKNHWISRYPENTRPEEKSSAATEQKEKDHQNDE
jgi:hypothetical protein